MISNLTGGVMKITTFLNLVLVTAVFAELTITKIKRPRDEEEGGYGFEPCCVVNNSAPGTVTGLATCEITDLDDGIEVYDDAMSSYPFPPGNTDVYFEEFFPEPNRHYNARFTVDAPGTGDARDKNFITTGYDITPVEILEPLEWWPQFAPSARYEERANLETPDVWLCCEIRELPSGSYYYTDSLHHDFEPGENYDAVFPEVIVESDFTIIFWARDVHLVNLSNPPLEQNFYQPHAVAEYPPESPTHIELGVVADDDKASIRFNISQRTEISLAVFDASGSHVAEIWHGFVDAGEHNLSWDVSGQPPGMYFIRLNTAGYCAVEKLVLIR